MTYALLAWRFLRGLPWQLWLALACIAALYASYRAGWNARDTKADADEAAMVAEYHAAQDEALARAIAARNSAEARYRALARQSEIDHAQTLAAADAATDRYISRNRVRSCPTASAGGGTPAPAASDGPGLADDVPAGFVVVAEADVRACGQWQAYGLAARKWALGLADSAGE